MKKRFSCRDCWFLMFEFMLSLVVFYLVHHCICTILYLYQIPNHERVDSYYFVGNFFGAKNLTMMNFSGNFNLFNLLST